MRSTHRAFNKEDPKQRYYLCDCPDCAFLTEKGSCMKLNVAQCVGSGCAFIKTEREISGIDERWQKRLSALDTDTQIAIAKKYYSGKMPWKTPGSPVDNKDGGK